MLVSVLGVCHQLPGTKRADCIRRLLFRLVPFRPELEWWRNGESALDAAAAAGLISSDYSVTSTGQGARVSRKLSSSQLRWSNLFSIFVRKKTTTTTRQRLSSPSKSVAKAREKQTKFCPAEHIKFVVVDKAWSIFGSDQRPWVSFVVVDNGKAFSHIIASKSWIGSIVLRLRCNVEIKKRSIVGKRKD